MDIYSFINIKNLSQRCRSMKHKFTPLEMAIIINNSMESSHKKYEAYNWIIENTPDCEVPESKDYFYSSYHWQFDYLYHWHYHSSLHELLRRIMYVENKIYNLFIDCRPKEYYELYVKEDCEKCENDCKDSSEWCESSKHPTMDKAIETALNYKYLIEFLIHKRLCKRHDDPGGLHIHFNKNGEPCEIARYGVFDKDIPQDEIGITKRNGSGSVGGIVNRMIKQSIKNSKTDKGEYK